jgi:hypothetical protein
MPLRANAEPSITWTEGEIKIDLSEEHPKNASTSIRKSLEFDSNVNVESESHSLKQDLHKIVTEEGIQIIVSDEHPRNASPSIRVSLELDSNANLESEEHLQKQD